MGRGRARGDLEHTVLNELYRWRRVNLVGPRLQIGGEAVAGTNN